MRRRKAARTLVTAALLLAGAAAAHAQSCVTPPPDMVAWWPFDETVGPTAAEIVNGNDGTHLNGAAPLGAGYVAAAIELDGADDFVEAPDDATLNLGQGDFSIDAWIRPDAFPDFLWGIVDKREDAAVRGYFFYLQDGTLALQMATNGLPQFQNFFSGILVPVGTWSHVAVTVDRDDPAGVRFYLDGAPMGSVLDPTGQPGSLDNKAPLRIGASHPFLGDPEQFFLGAIDEVEIFDRVLTPAEVASLFAADQAGKCKDEPPCVQPPADMAGWWPLDETSGTTAADIEGGHDGTHVNGPTPSPGYVAGGLSFDGVDDGVEVPDHPDLDVGFGDFSLDAWIRTSADAGIQQIVDKRTDVTTTVGYGMFLVDGVLFAQLADGAGTSGHTNYGSGAFVADGEWHHVAVAVDRSDPAGLRFYVDGALVASANPLGRAGSLDNTADLWIGKRHPIATVLYFDGVIDEVELFHRALGDAEVADLFAAQHSGKCKSTGCIRPPVEMIGWWPLDETAGPIAVELMNGNDGTHLGTPLPTPGQVAGALYFDGIDDVVEVPDDPLLDVGEGDFSIDAWIQTTAGTGIQQIVDKRAGLVGDTVGYGLFLQDGALLAQLADDVGSPGHTNYASSTALADGAWHHVALTVDRDDPAGLKLFVDGAVVATHDPTARAGTLDNGADLWIGMRHPINTAIPYRGHVDEVELFRRELGEDEVLAIYAAGPDGKCKATRCTPPPDAMAGWWPLDETTPDVAFAVQGGHDGAHVGCPAPVLGAVDVALHFDGVDDGVEVPHDPALDVGTGDFSIDAWIRTEAATGIEQIVDKRTGPVGTTVGYGLFLVDGALAAQLADGADTNYVSTTNVADGQWHHVAVTVDRDDPTGLQLFVDGASVSTFDPTGRSGNLDNPAQLWIGKRHPINTVLYYAGDVDEVELFTRELSPDEVLALYEAGPFGKCKEPEPELLVLTHSPLVRGQTATFVLSGALPGETVYFARSLAGTGCGPCIPLFGGLCVNLVSPGLLGTATADPSGVATLTITVPPTAPLADLTTQAAIARGVGGVISVKSNTVTAPILP